MPKQPFRFEERTRIVSRRATMRGLLEEIEYGDSTQKLYAGLLVNSIFETDHKMKEAFAWKLERITRGNYLKV